MINYIEDETMNYNLSVITALEYASKYGLKNVKDLSLITDALFLSGAYKRKINAHKIIAASKKYLNL